MIYIGKNTEIGFYYHDGENLITGLCVSPCEECKEFISPIYSDIIDALKKKGLLPKNFKKTCCRCFHDKNLLP